MLLGVVAVVSGRMRSEAAEEAASGLPQHSML
jgi:hypothetical protein